jgi:hypothetical protein
MALNYTDTAVLLAAYKEQKAPNTFLQSRYFPDGTVFTTAQVLVEYKDGNQKLAPFVSPEIGGKVVRRNGYEANAYKPAFIAPKRALTIDNLTEKGFGEALYGELTPEERAVKITADDLTEMDEMIVRRHEQMCAQVLQENALTMNHYGDDNKLIETKKIEYFNGVNEAIYTTSVKWDTADADIIGEVAAIAKLLTKRGLPATDVILGSEAADAFLNNEKIQKLLDNRNYNIGAVDPTENFPEATFLGVINCKGRKMNFIQYDATYEAEDGKDTPYINPKDIIVTAPGCGVTNYGAITQINYGESMPRTHAEKRVPLYAIKDQVREVALRTAPLVQPRHKNAFIKATVL